MSSLEDQLEFAEAVSNGDEERAVELLKANPEFKDQLPGNPDGNALSYAATAANLNLVKRFFELGSRRLQLALGSACRSPADAYRPIIEYLLSQGAEIDGLYYKEYGPGIFVPCENLHPDLLQMLIDLGANPKFEFAGNDGPATPLSMLLGSYVRRPAELHACLDVLERSGVELEDTPRMAIYRGDCAALARHIDADADVVNSRFDFDSPNTPLHGATLLHLAAEMCEVEAARLLLDRGADPNAAAGTDAEDFGGQSPIYHTVNSIWNAGFPVCELLVERGADLACRCNLRHLGYQRTFENITPLGYAVQMARDDVPHENVVALLKQHGAAE